jgi:hypothetical protein
MHTYLIGILVAALSGIVISCDRTGTATPPVDVPRITGAVGHAEGALVGGAATPRELVTAALAGFAAHDTAALARLLVSRDEFMRVIYPELGAHFAAARDTRTETKAFLWENQHLNALQGMRKALRELGGDTLALSVIEFTEGSKTFPSYVIHEGTDVTVTKPGGELATLYAFGSIVEMEGRYKLMSYRDLD